MNPTVVERLDIKNELTRRGIRYREVCNAIGRRIGWLTSRLNGYTQMEPEDEKLIARGLKILETEYVSALPEDFKREKE
jgi:hypothetical protein